MKRRVVVTGLGIVSPLGNDLASSWEGITHGRSGIGPLTNVADAYVDRFTTKIAGEVKGFDITADNELFGKFRVSGKDAKKMDPFIHYGLGASFMALHDSGLEITDANAERIGAIVGAGIGGLLGIEEQTIEFHEGKKISPFYVPKTIINMLPGQLSIITGLKGPSFSAVSACATSNHSIGTAMRMIQYGDADVMVVGGAERGSSPTALGGFCAMKAMSTRNDAPEQASRPWDKDRDGFVLGDGAGILILEEYEHAKEEDIVFKLLTNPTEILADENGWVRGIRCIEMELGEPDARGRRRPIEKPGSEFEMECDAVIMALGTSPNPLLRKVTPDMDYNEKGGIVADEHGVTTKPGVFAGGDAVTGAATVIKAMGAGKEAAAAIDRYIMKK